MCSHRRKADGSNRHDTQTLTDGHPTHRYATRHCPNEPANTLFIYTGEVQCKFVSGNNTTLNDVLTIVLPDADLGLGQVIGPPVPIILPTSWNANDGFSVIAINNPTVGTIPNTLTGLTLTANIAVQNGMLLNVQYQLSLLARV
jgi:hypothetical protein